jgi:hypothetical protein
MQWTQAIASGLHPFNDVKLPLTGVAPQSNTFHFDVFASIQSQMRDQMIPFAFRGLEREYAAWPSDLSRGQQGKQSVMRPNIKHGHARAENARDKFALSPFITGTEHGLSAVIVSGQPPSDMGHTHRQWN